MESLGNKKSAVMVDVLNDYLMSHPELQKADERGRALRKGKVQRASDKRYMYTYTDPQGRRKFIYAQDLTTLREKEKQLMKDQLDGLDLYVAGKATLNTTFDRYMSIKHDLRATTRSNYIYMYDRFVRETFGKKKIADIKFSDVLQFPTMKTLDK